MEAPHSERFSAPNAEPILPEAVSIDPATITPIASKKGGKDGEGGQPPTADPPPSPPLEEPHPENVPASEPKPPFHAEGVFSPAPPSNPVVSALKAQNLYLQEQRKGRHTLTCPFADQHGGEDVGEAVYIEPDEHNSFGRFTCPHRHNEPAGIQALLDKLKVDASLARCKPRIRIVTGDLTPVLAAAEYVLAQHGGLFQSNGSMVAVRMAANDIRMEQIGEQQLAIELSRAAYWEKWDGRSKDWVRAEPQSRFCQMLLKGYTYKYLPDLRGLSRQPYLREEDGELVVRPGYDRVSRIYGCFSADIAFAEPTMQQANAALKRMDALLSEFPFETEVDRSAALCAMLTAAVRPTLKQAPAFSVTAAMPGSGKSYLAATIIPFAGPGEPLNMSYPSGTEEAAKALPAALVQNPAVIAFDDMQGDWVPTSVINRVLTSPVISERQLGTNRMITASTRTFMIGTGNNIGPVRDMTRRVVSIRLAPDTDKPAFRRFEGNPIKEVTANRERYVVDALTVIRAYRAQGDAIPDAPPIGSFEQWSEACRFPLIWLGWPDPAQSLLDQVGNDPDLQALAAFVRAWNSEFGGSVIKVRQIDRFVFDNPASDLAEAIAELPVMDRHSVNTSKLGWFLRKNMERPIDGFLIRQVKTAERLAWQLVEIKPSP